MAKVERFEELECWREARALTRRIYRLTGHGNFARDFAFRDQIRRASVSVMSNIAEGFESRTTALFVDLLGRAKGSAGEIRAQLYIAHDADFLTQEEFASLSETVVSVSQQISGLMKYLSRNKKDFPQRAVPPA